MSINSKSANSQTVYNFISTVVRTGIATFTLPIFTRLLGTAQYGKYNVYLSWFNVLTCIIALGCGQGIQTGIYAFKDDYKRFKSSILLGGTCMCLITSVVGILLFKPLSLFFSLPIYVYILLFVESAASFVIGFSNIAWIYEKKANLNMLVSLTIVLSTTLLSLCLVLRWPGNPDNLYLGRVLGIALPNIAVAVVIWCALFLKHPAGYIKKYWAYSFAFGVPTMFHLLSHQVLTSSDRIMMERFAISNSEIGIYSFFYTLTSMLGTILSALNNSWVPFLYDDLDKKNYSRLNKRVVNYVQVFTILACGFILLAREVSMLFANEEYWPGMPVIPILVIVIYCTFVYQFPVNYEFFKGKPKIIAIGTISAAIENIILNAVMIPWMGMYGAAIATLISYITLAVVHIVIVYNWKEEKYPLSFRPIVFGLLMVIVSSIIYYILKDFWLIRWLIGSILGVYLLASIKKRHSIF